MIFLTFQIHSQNGRYYRIRIPKFGRDLVYQPSTCDVFFVGDSSEVSRLNLEQGRFLNPLKTESAAGFNVCALNQDHHLFLCGKYFHRFLFGYFNSVEKRLFHLAILLM